MVPVTPKIPHEFVTKKLVVRAKQPFRVLNVDCPDGCFEIQSPSEDSRKLHFISVKYTAGEEPGKVKRLIQIETDLATGVSTECQASATIVEEE